MSNSHRFIISFIVIGLGVGGGYFWNGNDEDPERSSVVQETKSKPKQSIHQPSVSPPVTPNKTQFVTPPVTPNKTQPITPRSSGVDKTVKGKPKAEPVTEVQKKTGTEYERPNDIVYEPSEEGIKAAVRAFIPEIRKCYSAFLHDYPGTPERIDLELTLTPPQDDDDESDLAYVDTQLVSNIEDEQFENCIIETTNQMWFNPPTEIPAGETEPKIVIAYPIIFATSE